MKAYFFDGPLAGNASEMSVIEQQSMTIMVNYLWAGLHQHTAQYFPLYEGTLAGLPVCVMTTRTDIAERDLINLIDEAMAIQLTAPDEEALADRTSLQLDSGILDTLSMNYIRRMALLNKRLLEIQNESVHSDKRRDAERSDKRIGGRSGQPDGAQ